MEQPGSRFHFDTAAQKAVAAFVQGTGEDLEAFITLFQPIVETSVRHILQNTGDVEQAVIDVFFKLWRSRARLPPNEGILYYVLAVARRVAIDHYRREKRHAPPGRFSTCEPYEYASPARPQPEWARLELEDWVAALSPALRATFVEYYLEGRTAKEIAARHGCALPTVYTQLRRAKAALRARREMP